MTKSGLLIATAAMLAGCSSHNPQQPGDSAAYPARIPLAAATASPDVAPQQPKGAAWQAGPTRLAFGVPGSAPLLTLACEGGNLIVTRHVRAEAGAKALFALIGNGRIARLPVDVAMPGEDGLWQGNFPADDPRLDVLKGGNTIEATLPGGGSLKLSPSREPERLLKDCRASAPKPQAS